MMIPKRIHCDLPDDLRWIISDYPRQLTVYLANDVPEDSPLEQHFVRQATRAWRHRHYPGPLVILPIAATGVAWTLRKLRHPLAATGVVAGGAMVALAAVTSTGPDGHPRAPTVIGAPPTHSPAAPPRTGSPAPSRPPGTSPPPPSPSPSPPAVTPTPTPQPGAPGTPGKTHPTTGRGNSGGKPGRTPPGHGATPPGHGGTPPGKPSPPPGRPPAGPPSAEASACQLMEIQVGHLVRICI